MIIDSVPGLTIHEHEGRLSGGFELPPADLAAITFDGRVMLVLIADVGVPFSVVTTKDGNHRARWTFKAVDAALVRDESMRQHLEKALYLDGSGIALHPLDEEDAQREFKVDAEDDRRHLQAELNELYPPDQREAWSLKEDTVLGSFVVGTKLAEDTKPSIFSPGVRAEDVEGEEVIERFGDPITIPGDRERPDRPDRIVHAFDPDHDPSDNRKAKDLDDFLWRDK